MSEAHTTESLTDEDRLAAVNERIQLLTVEALQLQKKIQQSIVVGDWCQSCWGVCEVLAVDLEHHRASVRPLTYPCGERPVGLREIKKMSASVAIPTVLADLARRLELLEKEARAKKEPLLKQIEYVKSLAGKIGVPE